MDVGEGMGSIGIAAAAMTEGVFTVGIPGYVPKGTWVEKGMTCVIGECGGTKGNPPGPKQHLHRQQLGGRDQSRRVHYGQVTGSGGRREYSTQAARNMVAPELVQQIIRAAIKAREQRPTKRRRCQRM